MLNLDHISLSFGGTALLDDISALINPGERVGLVGPNGAGKSSLLKIIAGELTASSGAVRTSKQATVGYLPQDGVDPDPSLSVIEEVESAFGDLLHLEKELQKAQTKLTGTEEGTELHASTLDKVGKLQHRIETSGLYELRASVEKVLMGLGFKESDFPRSTTEFSGGWLMRIALAKLLLKRPTYLLLDEPTNHLDIESLQWIEQFLVNYEGAVIVVSHDRAFLDRITTRTLWLDRGDLYDYAGNYSYFEEKHEEQMELLRKAYKNQQQEIKETERFIERFRYKASKAKQVQSRIKQLEKMDRIELNEHEEEVTFRFPPPERSGAVVMRLNNIQKNYGNLTVFDGVDWSIDRGEKIAVVGPNGAGKSTLIRIMAGLESIQGGERELGHNVTCSYFAQHQAEELNAGYTALEVMQEAAPREAETRLRTILGCFLFTGEEVFKKVSVLSGGEKSRLALARMLLMPANFLIFDEPTNHLDMQSKKILQQALQQYEGTVIIVSHDRSFLDPIVDKVLEVQPGRLRTYLGNVSYYLDKKKEEQALSADSEGKTESSSSDSDKEKTLSRKEQRRIEAEKRQEKSRKLKPLRNRLSPVEARIGKLEQRQSEIEELMGDADFYDDSDRVKEITMEYDKLKAELVEIYAEWEELASKISEIEEEYA